MTNKLKKHWDNWQALFIEPKFDFIQYLNKLNNTEILECLHLDICCFALAYDDFCNMCLVCLRNLWLFPWEPVFLFI